jgi:hypothetical protein
MYFSYIEAVSLNGGGKRNRHDDNIRNNSGDSSNNVQGQGKNDMLDCLFAGV